jgi:hypothetical protein
MKASRRSFFAFMGTAPLAAKVAADEAIAKAAGSFTSIGLGNSSLGLSYGGLPQASGESFGVHVPYEKRLIGAADYVKMFGLPEVMEFELRDRSRSVNSLDPDIACKASWSMSVKLMTQRQRNYEREIQRIEKSGWQQRGRSTLKNFLGFDWPW